MTTPTPEYNPNTPPNASSTIGNTQEPMLDNFTVLYNAFEVNHVTLDNSITANRGLHTILQITAQENPFQTGPGVIAMYSDQGTESTPNTNTDQLFLQYQNNQTPFQYTTYQIYPLSDNNPTQFFTFLPGNILVYFGIIPVPFTSSRASYSLKLLPAVCTNILSMNFCAVGTFPSLPPSASLQTPGENNIYDTIILSSNRNLNITQLSYIIMGNL